MTKKPDPTKDPAFQKTLTNLLRMTPKTQSEMKIGKKPAKTATQKRRSLKKKAD